MFNMGFTELLLLAIIAIIFIGPKELPEVARTIGRLLNEWKKATNELTSSMMDIAKERPSTKQTSTEPGSDTEASEQKDTNSQTPQGSA